MPVKSEYSYRIPTPSDALNGPRKRRTATGKRLIRCAFVPCRAVARGGVEPPTFRFSVGRSYQLSYLAD